MTWLSFKSKEAMRVTKNEKFLLLILLAIVFFGGNFMGYRWLMQKQATLKLSCAQLKADQAEARVELQESSLWTQRKAWIQDHQPTMGDEGDAKAQVLEYALKGARDNKLEILQQSLGDTQRGASGTRVNVSVTVKGSMQALATWLTALEKADQFYAISTFSLKADTDQKSMDCKLEIARYFKDKQGS
jgi:hypothetical protein